MTSNIISPNNAMIDHHTLGWREWVSLPALYFARIKAKVDTGARTSSLHAEAIALCPSNNKRVCFMLDFGKRTQNKLIMCEADIIDIRWVTDSGGHSEQRYVICTPIIISNQVWPIELTLTERGSMRFKMLLGRSAINQRFIVDPSRSFLQAKPQINSHNI